VVRNTAQLYPDYTQFITEIEENGITIELLQKIIQKHRNNALYNRKLYDRYMAVDGQVPIFKRTPRFKEDEPINNKINNDFMGEIVDFKTGYFAGKPIGYGYSKGEEAEEVTGGENAVDIATKTITDFVVRNNMYGVDMEVTKFASIYGYAGRLFYIDLEGNERVMPVHGYETIILSNTDSLRYVRGLLVASELVVIEGEDYIINPLATALVRDFVLNKSKINPPSQDEEESYWNSMAHGVFDVINGTNKKIYSRFYPNLIK
jgi:hypothetical protein